MSEIKLQFTGLKTDLRGVAGETMGRFSTAGNVLLTPGKDSEAFLTATNGRSLAIVPVEFKQRTETETIMPASLAFSKDGKEPLITQNGEWRRQEAARNGFSDTKVTVAPEVADARFPKVQDVLPTIEGTIAVTLDAKMLLALARAVNGESDSVTLFLPPTAMNRQVKKDADGFATNDYERIDSHTITGPVAVMGPNGIGVFVPMCTGSGDEGYGQVSNVYNAQREAFIAARKTA